MGSKAELCDFKGDMVVGTILLLTEVFIVQKIYFKPTKFYVLPFIEKSGNFG